MAVFDPFAYLDKTETEAVTILDEEMMTVEVGSKVLGIDEGLIIGIIVGYTLAQIVKEYL